MIKIKYKKGAKSFSWGRLPDWKIEENNYNNFDA